MVLFLHVYTARNWCVKAKSNRQASSSFLRSPGDAMRDKFALQHGHHAVPIFAGVIVLCFVVIATGCGGGGSSMPMTPSSATGTVSVSISDPPSCKNPNGTFEHVYITVRSVQAHTSANA